MSAVEPASTEPTGTGRGADWVSVVGASALTVLAIVGFESSYGGVRYLAVGAIGTGLGAIVALVSRRLGVGVPLSVLAAVAVYAVVGGVVALPEYAVGGVGPSLDTVGRAMSMAVTGWKELITTTPPVGSTGDLMVVPMAAGFWAAFASASLAMRLRFAPAALVPPLVAHGTSVATGVDTPASLLLQGSLFGAVALGWLAWREQQRRPLLLAADRLTGRVPVAVALLVVAFGVGHVGSDLVPLSAPDRSIWRQTVVPPFDPREHPSPLAGYRDYVKQASARTGDGDPVLLTVEGLPSDVPVRLATMDTYDGLTWQVSAGDAAAPSLADSGSFERVGVSIDPDHPGDEATVTIEVGSYSDVWVPDVGEVIELRFTGSRGGSERDRALADAFRYNRATDTAVTGMRLQPGDRYTMRVRLPHIQPNLAGTVIEPQVPKIGVTASVESLAQTLASPDLLATADTGARLDQVRDQMVEFGTYSDGDKEAGHVQSKAGHSAFRLTDFVKQYPDRPLIGNAEQYSSAFALLFRDLGKVPTRVVMGFLPSAASTAEPVEIHASEVEAWVEVPVADRGWVPIFPTPPRDQISVATRAPRQPEPDYRTQNPPPPPIIDPEFDAPATARGEAEGAERETKGQELAGGRLGWLAAPAARAVAAVSTPFVLLASAAVTISLLKRRRRRLRRSTGPGHRRIAAGWSEVTDFARDLGRPVPATTTRRESAEFVGDGSVALAVRADEAVWSGAEPSDDDVEAFWSDVEAYLVTTAGSLGRLERLRARTSLESLRTGRRTRRVT